MSHFSAIEWVDYARGLISRDKANLMQAATQTCDECKASFTFWGHIYKLLSREREYEPSGPVLQAVKDAFPDEKPFGWMTKLTDFATVVFDSFLQPGLVGVRSSGRSSRQITVESGAFVVDLQLESGTVQHQCSLTGQILGGGHSAAQIGGAEVVLLSPDRVLQKTKANELGEFWLDFNCGENLRLFIDIKGERGVGILLPMVEDSPTEPMQ
jgi:hypothetical protein